MRKLAVRLHAKSMLSLKEQPLGRLPGKAVNMKLPERAGGRA